MQRNNLWFLLTILTITGYIIISILWNWKDSNKTLPSNFTEEEIPLTDNPVMYNATVEFIQNGTKWIIRAKRLEIKPH